jgi:5-carboxymethyl-2-hydroxymuconic-semialdehyde dehydrogenase
MTHFVPQNLPDRIRHYIDGQFVDSVDHDTFDVLDPVTNETYTQAAAGKRPTSTWPSPPRRAPSPRGRGRA